VDTLYDQGWKKNITDFLWSGNLCADSFQVPEMNPHLQKKCREYAAQERDKQLRRDSQHRQEMTEQAAEAPEGPPVKIAVTSAQGDVVPILDGKDPASQLEQAVAQLPEDKQREMQVTQQLLTDCIAKNSTEVIVVPQTIPPERHEYITMQVKVMFQHYHHAMALMRQHQQTPTAAVEVASSTVQPMPFPPQSPAQTQQPARPIEIPRPMDKVSRKVD